EAAARSRCIAEIRLSDGRGGPHSRHPTRHRPRRRPRLHPGNRRRDRSPAFGVDRHRCAAPSRAAAQGLGHDLQRAPRHARRRDPGVGRHLRHRVRRKPDQHADVAGASRSEPSAAIVCKDRSRGSPHRGFRSFQRHYADCASHRVCRLDREPTLMLFRKRKPPRYPHRPPLPIIRRKLPTRYHMKHQFGVRDLAFLQTMHALTGSPMSDGNRVAILKNGIEIFPAMLAAIRDAKHTINLEFYIYWDGEIGRKFAEALAEKARAGVAVKVILDAVGSAPMSQSLVNFMARNGIDIEWYHPLRWYTIST